MRFRFGSAAVVLTLAVAVAVGGCGGSEAESSGGAGGAGETLTIAYAETPTSLDPDVFYAVEGESIITSVYEGLLTYKPESVELGPALATSWKQSPDGLTYTFHLRKGVRFQDGTPFNSAAVKTNFERRTALKQAVSYMLEDVVAIETPDPYTVVVKLDKPNNAFLDQLASFYGPKMISPKALRAHAEGDMAQKWLTEHAVGTGPYELVSFQINSSVELSRFDGYWGPRPSFERIVFKVIPDFGAQRLQLTSGGVDLMTHGIEGAELPTVEANSGLTAATFPATEEHVLYLNTHKPPFDDPELRRAFVAALKPDAAIRAVYGDTASPAISAFPAALSDEGKIGPLETPHGTPPAKPVKVVLAYAGGSGSSDLQRLVQYLQANVEKAGFEVTLKGDTYAQEFGYVSNLGAAPDALLSGLNPDAANPYDWAGPVWTSEGGLNLLGYSNPRVDALVEKGLRSTNKREEDRFYGEAAKLVQRDAAITTIDDGEDVIVARKGIGNFVHMPLYIWQVDLADLKQE